MISPTIGDLAIRFELRARMSGLKTDMSRLTSELSSGRKANISKAVGGDFTYLGHIEASLSKADRFLTANKETKTLTDLTVAQLERIRVFSGPLSSTVLTASVSTLDTALTQAGEQARDRLDETIGALNTNLAGQRLFSGRAFDTAPLRSSDDLLAGLGAALAGATTAADIDTAARAWFADPAGFEAQIYSGSTQNADPVPISDTEAVDLAVRADDAVFRDLMRNMALAVLATDPSLGLTRDVQEQVFAAAGEGLLSAQSDLTTKIGDLGFKQQRIEETQVRLAAEKTSLDAARSSLIEADPYKTALELEDVQRRLQSLYSVTARSAQLSLVNFLR